MQNKGQSVTFSELPASSWIHAMQIMTMILNNVIIFPCWWLDPDVAFNLGDTLGNLVVCKIRMRCFLKATDKIN